MFSWSMNRISISFTPARRISSTFPRVNSVLAGKRISPVWGWRTSGPSTGRSRSAGSMVTALILASINFFKAGRVIFRFLRISNSPVCGCLMSSVARLLIRRSKSTFLIDLILLEENLFDLVEIIEQLLRGIPQGSQQNGTRAVSAGGRCEHRAAPWCRIPSPATNPDGE